MAEHRLVSRQTIASTHTPAHSIRMLWALAAALIFTAPAAVAADDVRPSIVNKQRIAGDDAKRQPVRCPQNSMLVGVGANFTDRMVGYWYRCAEADPTTRQWKPNTTAVRRGIGQTNRGPQRWHDCPQNYYIVDLGVTTGIYGSGAGGAARLLADIQPVCQLPDSNPVVSYATPRAYFEHADDNSLRDIGPTNSPYDGRACATDSVAVGLQFLVDFRNNDPESQFIDVALICDRLPERVILKDRDKRVPIQ